MLLPVPFTQLLTLWICDRDGHSADKLKRGRTVFPVRWIDVQEGGRFYFEIGCLEILHVLSGFSAA